MVDLLISLGMIPLHSGLFKFKNLETGENETNYYEVFLNGRILGYIGTDEVKSVADKLRYLKALASCPVEMQQKDENYHVLAGLSKYMEICLVPKIELENCTYTMYPGLYLFTTPGRMMRPVRNLITKQVEYIGTMEQCYLHVIVKPEEFVENQTKHQELYPYSFMSVMANLTPFSEFNQSPRNMYQCQMGKQTMGTPCHSIRNRADNKLYRINFPQSPIVRTKMYDYFKLDDYPIGTNAVVAVVSYTGYDMEDAMILNKQSLERGFGHGMVYSTEIVELNEKSVGAARSSKIFGKSRLHLIFKIFNITV